MPQPELLFIAGCNAAGKSSFIRTQISNLHGYEIIMTDVYKSRTKEIFNAAITERKNIIIETVFNDVTFKDLIDTAKNAGYQTSLIALFLDTIQQSIERVAFRSLKQSGLTISTGNARINFNESFKNVSSYFFYFDNSDFLFTGITGKNLLIMRFQKSEIVKYVSNDLQFPQKFARFAFQNQRLSEKAYDIISQNLDFQHDN